VCRMLEDAGDELSGFAARGVAHVFACRDISHGGLPLLVASRAEVANGARKCEMLEDAGETTTTTNARAQLR
jgi:hypothetical protein